MGEWVYAVAAVILVLLAVCGAWMAVRVLRARKPAPKPGDTSRSEDH